MSQGANRWSATVGSRTGSRRRACVGVEPGRSGGFAGALLWWVPVSCQGFEFATACVSVMFSRVGSWTFCIDWRKQTKRGDGWLEAATRTSVHDTLALDPLQDALPRTARRALSHLDRIYDVFAVSASQPVFSPLFSSHLGSRPTSGYAQARLGGDCLGVTAIGRTAPTWGLERAGGPGEIRDPLVRDQLCLARP